MSGEGRAVRVLMVLAEEAGVEAARLGEFRLGEDLVHATIQVLAPRGAGDRGVETESHEPFPASRG
jgi:hypothetical protein